MLGNLDLLKVNKVILHDIPKHARSAAGSGPLLSEIESELDADLALYLRGKAIASLTSSRAFDIAFDPSTTSPIPGLIRRYLANPSSAEFIAVSQDMAKHLYAIQDGSNPAGILTVIDCVVGPTRSLAVLKLEREEGVQLRSALVREKRTFDILHLRDLILTEKTRLFKTALFVPSDESFETFQAAASDHQVGFSPQVEVASFFLRSFLGSKLLEDPQVATKRFYEGTERFINEEVLDPLRRTRYHGHLVSLLTSEQTTISPESFAQNYLVIADRQKFLTSLETQEVSTGSFVRSTELVQGRLKREMLEFQSGVSIIATPESLKEHVKLTKLDSGEMKAEVQDYLTSVRGRS